MEVKNDETIKEEESSELTQDDVIQLINEYMAEKEETIAQEITEKVESQLESIVDAKIAEALGEDESSEEEEEEETKATEDEEEDETQEEDETTEEEDEEEDKTKSNEPTVNVVQLIAESIDKALGDDFADKVAAKMFDNLDQNRTSTGSKFKQYQESLKEEPVEEPVAKSTYSTKETAEILMKKQQAANPILSAAMKNLH